MKLVHVTVSDAGGGSDQSMLPADRRGGGNHSQSLLHGQLLSASRRLSHATADTGNAENLVCFAKY